MRGGGGMSGNEAECSEMNGVLRGSEMLRVGSQGNKWGPPVHTQGNNAALFSKFAEQMTWLKNPQLTGWLQWCLPF